MRVLVLENYHATPLGQVAVALDAAGAQRDHVRPFHGAAVPASAGEYDALIVLGGAQNALDDEGHPWFPATIDLIRDFGSGDRAVLGICLGAQLIARAYGAENRIGGHREFGWRRVTKDAGAAGDKIFGALPPSFPIFEWHDDHYTLPAGAVRLTSSDRAENQAFRIGRAVYGTQFHFEADRPLVAQWSIDFAELIAASEPDWPAEHLEQARRDGPEADAAGLALARAWVTAI